MRETKGKQDQMLNSTENKKNGNTGTGKLTHKTELKTKLKNKLK